MTNRAFGQFDVHVSGAAFPEEGMRMVVLKFTHADGSESVYALPREQAKIVGHAITMACHDDRMPRKPALAS